MTGRHLTAVVGVAVVLAACNGSGGQDVAQPEPTPTPTATATITPSPSPTATASPSPTPSAEPTATEDAGEARQWTSCDHPEGITVSYPQGWHVNSGDTLPACSAFDPEALDVPEAQEFLDAAALLSVEPVDFATIAAPSSRAGEELSRRQTTVDGHDAVRIETEAQGDALLAEGSRTTQWMVVLGRKQTLTLTTHEIGTGDEYAEHRAVLDEMVTRLDLPDNV